MGYLLNPDSSSLSTHQSTIEDLEKLHKAALKSMAASGDPKLSQMGMDLLYMGQSPLCVFHCGQAFSVGIERYAKHHG